MKYSKEYFLLIVSRFSVPFSPKQPIESLKIGDIYLKSIDQEHRRKYEKYCSSDNSERENDKQQQSIDALYVRKIR